MAVFVRTGEWGEVKRKCAEPGEEGSERARGTLGKEKGEAREASSSRLFVFPIVLCVPLICHFSHFLLSPRSLAFPTEKSSVEERARKTPETLH